MLIKLLGIVAIGFLGLKGVTLCMKQFDWVVNLSTNTTTMSEVKSISKIIYIDFIIATGSLPENPSGGWRAYIRNNMQSDLPNRDTSVDIWQTPYRVREKGTGFVVSSAGPDKKFGTSDDIEAGYSY
ncbi:MAG: hypothetical protein HQK83_05915 [Fibrobacteria bacterium]|nr:hypothetical protein [Fibrobacteria bacterium]